MSKKNLFAILILLTAFMLFFYTSAYALDGEYMAYLDFASADWMTQEHGLRVSTSITGAGEYTLIFEGEVSGIALLRINIPGAAADFRAAGLVLTDLKLFADGQGIPLDVSKVRSGELAGDGDYCIEVFNEYSDTESSQSVDPSRIRFLNNLTIQLTLSVANTPADPPSSNTAPDLFDESIPPDEVTPSESSDRNSFIITDNDRAWLIPVSVFSVAGVAGVAAAIFVIKRKRS